MSFKEIANQDHIVRFLRSSFASKRIAGGYLFLGKEGVGRQAIAREFTKLINCQNPDDDSCDDCIFCRKIQEDKSVDVHWYRPINNSITIAQMRDLGKYAHMSAYELTKKVFIICDAQCLTEEASNALLKTLEEPPDDTVIILIADQTQALLQTICSRCQKIVFNALNEETLKNSLIDSYHLSPTRAHYISYLAQGNMKEALEFLELGDDLIEKRKHILNAIYFKKFSLFSMEEFKIKDNTVRRKRVGILLDMLLSWLRDLLVLKTDLNTPLVNMDKKNELMRFLVNYTQDELTSHIKAVARAKFLINADININVRLAISTMRAEVWKPS